jgi:hypothetical protein
MSKIAHLPTNATAHIPRVGSAEQSFAKDRCGQFGSTRKAVRTAADAVPFHNSRLDCASNIEQTLISVLDRFGDVGHRESDSQAD